MLEASLHQAGRSSTPYGENCIQNCFGQVPLKHPFQASLESISSLCELATCSLMCVPPSESWQELTNFGCSCGACCDADLTPPCERKCRASTCGALGKSLTCPELWELNCDCRGCCMEQFSSAPELNTPAATAASNSAPATATTSVGASLGVGAAIGLAGALFAVGGLHLRRSRSHTAGRVAMRPETEESVAPSSSK